MVCNGVQLWLEVPLWMVQIDLRLGCSNVKVRDEVGRPCAMEKVGKEGMHVASTVNYVSHEGEVC